MLYEDVDLIGLHLFLKNLVSGKAQGLIRPDDDSTTLVGAAVVDRGRRRLL
jgi:hypothetical protein